MKTKGLLTALAFVSLALTACAPGVQPLLDEYNALFDSVTERGQGGIGPHAKDWLYEHYEVGIEGTLNLYAPLGCTSYRWELVPEKGGHGKIPDKFNIDIYGGKTQHLYIDLKAAQFEPGYFTLTCTVVLNGETITDEASVNFVDNSDERQGGGI